MWLFNIRIILCRKVHNLFLISDVLREKKIVPERRRKSGFAFKFFLGICLDVETYSSTRTKRWLKAHSVLGECADSKKNASGQNKTAMLVIENGLRTVCK